MRIIKLALWMLLLSLPVRCFATTWYVSAIGGTRYSANNTSGQCNGQAYAAYPGTGVNQPCAFNDWRLLYDNQTYGSLTWVIAGSDTVILDNNQKWRVGFGPTASNADNWCYGDDGPAACFNPPIPPGTPTNPTRILGINYQDCANGHIPIPGQMTQMFGGFTDSVVLSLYSTQNVDVECIELTSHQTCIQHGSPAVPYTCNDTSSPVDDYASNGFGTNNTTAGITMTNMWIHGLTNDCEHGSLGPGALTLTGVDLSTCGDSIVNFDDGTLSAAGATYNILYSIVEYGGCNQEYPLVHAIPVESCYGQSNGGYGDGLGTVPGAPINMTIDHTIFRYSTQDGFDGGHIQTGNATLKVTNSVAYGNGGQGFKWGPNFTTVTFENNLLVANCNRMAAPLDGAPAGYNANLGDFCRAGDMLSFNYINGGQILIANNTFLSYASTSYDVQCQDLGSTPSCATTVLNFNNNVTLLYGNTSTVLEGALPGGWCGQGCNTSTLILGNFNRKNNLYYGMRGSCIANDTTQLSATNETATDEVCADPLLQNEVTNAVQLNTNLEYALDVVAGPRFGFGGIEPPGFYLTSGSPAVHTGVPISGLTTDYAGLAYATPPSMGALELETYAYQADKLVDMIAVNTHICQSGFPNSIYRNNAAQVEAAFKNSGIRHYRDCFVNPTVDTAAVGIFNTLAGQGMTGDFIHNSTTENDTTFANYVNGVDEFEPVNEDDGAVTSASGANNFHTYLTNFPTLMPANAGQYKVLGPSFANLVSSSPNLSNGGFYYSPSILPTFTLTGGAGTGMTCTTTTAAVPTGYYPNGYYVTGCSCTGGTGYTSAPTAVIAGSGCSYGLGNGATATIGVSGGAAASCTIQNLAIAGLYGVNNVHYYPAGYYPEFSGYGGNNCQGYGYGSLAWALTSMNVNSTSLPSQITEEGYYNIIGYANGLPEKNSAAYFTRFLLLDFLNNIKRVYLYQLIDIQLNSYHEFIASPGAETQWAYGLIRNDFSYKPQFYAISSLIHLLQDPGPTFTTQPLAFTVTGSTANVRTMLFQKRTGVWMVAVWIASSGYNTNSPYNATPVTPQSVTVTVNGGPRVHVLYQMDQGGGIVTTSESTAALTFNATDVPAFLQIL